MQADSRHDATSAIALSASCEGSGMPLVMLGGGTTGAEGFAPHAQGLAGDFHVIRLQTLNVARAEQGLPLPADYSVKCEAQAMHNALQKLDIKEPIHLIGHSLGALVALDFALDHALRVRSLVLSEPPAFWVVPQSQRLADPDMCTMMALVARQVASREPGDGDLIAFLQGLGDYNVRVPSLSESGRPSWDARRRSLRGLSAVVEHHDEVHRLGRLHFPVLLIEGRDTAPFHRRINELLAANLPQAQRVVLFGGHAAALIARDAFLQAVRAFFARL